MRLRPILLPVIAAALVGACSASSTGSGPSGAGASTATQASPSSAVAAGSLDGHTYVSTSVTGHTLVPGTTVTLHFDAGRLGVNAGCNTMSGGYAVVDGTLKLDAMATTEMACEADRMAQDAWLAAFLPGASTSHDGTTLTLAKDGVTMGLVDQQTTNLPIDGTVWSVDGLISGDAVSSMPTGVTASLVFSGGRVAVHAGCNTGSGTAAISPGTIAFGPLALTRMMCSADAMAVEHQVTTVLQGTQPYRIEGASLTIGGNGAPGLTLKGAAAGSTPNPGPS